MKKIFVALVLGFSIISIACADNERITRNLNDLPAPAREVVNKEFANTKVSYIKIDKDLFKSTTYEVQFVNGMEITFDKDGNWIEVDCQRSEVPAAFVPAQIKKQVNDMFPGEKVIKIEKEPRHYDVELGNDIDIKFDKNFKIKKVD